MLKRAQTFLTRRQFYKIAAFILSYTAFGARGNRAQVMMPDVASNDLGRIVTQNAKARDDPWLLIHGIRAMGKDFPVGQQKAIDYLCSHYLRQRSVNGETYIYMPIDYEHHPHCFLSEAILDAGVPLDYIFQSNGNTYSVADLVSAARALFEFDPLTSDSDTLVADKLAWSLTTFAYTTDPADDTWINAYRNQIRFSSVIDSAIAVLERGTQHLQSAMHNPGAMPTTDGVHDFACAGTHLIYGLTTCLKFGHHTNGLTERMKPQFDVLIWRLENDLKLIDIYYDQLGSEYPADVERMYRLDTKLKFLGHTFEIINYIYRFKLFEPTTAQQGTIARARQGLSQVVHEIASDGIDKYKEDRILFKLLVGDSCHAYHAISMGA
jgi:hypothetical protein